MLKTNFNVQVNPSFKILSSDQVKQVHLFSMEILEKKGVAVHHDKVRKLLKDVGCYVQDKTVRFPASLIKWGIDNTPERVVLANSDGMRKMFLQQGNVYYGVGSYEQYESKNIEKNFKENTAKICNDLSHMEFIECQGLRSFRLIREHTKKPLIIHCQNVKEIKKVIDLGVSLSGDIEDFKRNPSFTVSLPVDSALSLNEDAIKTVTICAEHGVPLSGMCLIDPSNTDPDSIAGSIALGNATILALLIILQLSQKGSPFIYGFTIGNEPLQSALSYGVTGALSNYYNIPSWAFSVETKSYCCDQQAALETSFLIQAAAFSGINMVSLNYRELEQLVMGQEIIGMTQHFLKGVEINEDTIPLDLIHEIGAGGHYLMAEHTLKYYKTATFYPKYMNRQSFTNWENQDGKSMGDKLTDKVQAVIGAVGGKGVDVSILKKIDQLITEGSND